MVDSSEEKVFTIRADTEQAKRNVTSLGKTLLQLQAVSYGAMGILARLGLGPEISEAARQIQRFISLVTMARIQINLLYATTGPVGWAMFGLSLVGTALTAADMYGDLYYDYQRGRPFSNW